MKKTFIDTTFYSFSVKESSSILQLAQSTVGYLEILSKNYDTQFIVRSEQSFDSILHNSVRVFFYKGKWLRKWQIPVKYLFFLKSFQPHFILVHGFGYAHYLIFLKMMCPKAKILLQCNGFASKPRGLKKWIYSSADHFIDGYLFTGIDNAKEWYASKTINREKIFEVMEGATHFTFNPQVEPIENSYLWVGSLNENKDPITILKAFQLFLVQQPTAKLTMVFQDELVLSEVNELLSSNQKLSEAVAMVGFVAHHLLEELYNKHLFFVLGSHYEGSGYALLEAMSCGCVPIVTDIPSYRFMTDNGNCALLFSPENVQELLSQLRQSQKIDYSVYQTKVLQQYENKLSFKAIAKDIDHIFQSL